MHSPESPQHWSAAHGAYVDSRTGSPFPAQSMQGRFGLLVRAGQFLLVFSLLQISWELSRGGALEQAVIHDAMVRPAAALIRLLTPTIAATADGFSIKAPGGGLNILNGCEGIEALFLLLAAFAATPMAWRPRLQGAAFGAALLIAANQLRILALFYSWRADPALFATLHGTVVPVAMILLIGGYYHAWLSRAAHRTVKSA